MEKSKNKIKRLALNAALASLAIIMGYIEAVIPINIGIPGIKIGFANIVTVIAISLFGFADAFVIGLVRVLTVGLLFSNFSMLVFSIGGFLISIAVMQFFKLLLKRGIIVCSMFGAISHNVTQIIIASIIMDNFYIWKKYLAVLIMVAVLTGILIGTISFVCYKTIKKYFNS